MSEEEKYTAIYSRYFNIYTFDSRSIEEAEKTLEYIEDYGEGFAIAIVEKESCKMVWHKDFIRKEEAQVRVDEYLQKLVS
jgi:hypothetical protein